MTILEAVNNILSAATLSPVSTVEESVNSDSNKAYTLLLEKAETIQAQGFNCNTQHNVEMIPDAVTSEINLSGEILNIEASASESLRILKRGSRLFNVSENSYVFDRNIYCNATYHLEWTILPLHIQNYIVAHAARLFVRDTLGTGGILKDLEKDESIAYMEMQKVELRIGNHNILTGSVGGQRSTNRYLNPLPYRRY